MNKFRRIVFTVLAIVMAAALLTSCAPKTSVETSPSAAATSSAPATSEAPASASGVPATPPEGDLAQIFALPNQVPWTGLINPSMSTRADIDKAIEALNKKDNVKVGYVTWTNGTPYFKALTDTIKAECDKYGWEFITAVSDADNAKQVAAIENMVTLGVDIIIDNDWSIEAESVAIKAAVEAGIPCIGLGLPFPDSTPVITTAASDFYGQGFLVGMLAADQYNGIEVKAATSCGMIGHPIAEGKLNGFIGGFVYERAIQMGIPFATKVDAMLYGYELEQQIVKNAKFSDPTYNWSIVSNIDGYWSQEGGQKALEDIVTAHPDINVVFVDNDQEAFGGIKALTQAGFKVGTDVQIVCVGDGDKQALQMVKDGTILGMTLASPYTWAKATTDLARKIFIEGFDATNLPASVQLDNVLVTKDNVDMYMPTTLDYAILPDQVFTPIGK